jgi:hypothetical protein
LAGRDNVKLIATEHLLLGVVSWRNVATTFLQHANVDRLKVRAVVEALDNSDAEKREQHEIGDVHELSTTAYQAVIYAKEEGRRDGGTCTDISHLLIGLIRDATTPAGRVLADLGVTVDQIRDAEKMLEDGTLNIKYFPEDASDASLSAVLKLLQDEDASIREEAVGQLHRYVNIAAYERADHSLTGHAGAEAEHAASIDVWQDSRIVAALLVAMDDPVGNVRCRAPLLLGHVKTASAQEAIIRHLRSDPADSVRLMCVMGIGWTADTPQKVSALTDALQDSQPNVVFIACSKLGKIGDSQAVSPLRAVLVHPAWKVRFNACEALVRLQAVDETIVTVLEELSVQPEAEEHNKMVSKPSITEKVCPETAGKSGPPRTTEYVLELAKKSMRS